MRFYTPQLVSAPEDASGHLRKGAEDGGRSKKPHFSDATEKKREQNRVSAKRSRAKKAILIDQLKLRVETLKGENSMLHEEVEKYFGERVATLEIMKARSTPLWMRELSQTTNSAPEQPRSSPYQHRARHAAKHAPIASRSDILRLNHVDNDGQQQRQANNAPDFLGRASYNYNKERDLEKPMVQSIDDCFYGAGKGASTPWEFNGFNNDEADGGLGDVLSFFT